jgi:hypothetical protein
MKRQTLEARLKQTPWLHGAIWQMFSGAIMEHHSESMERFPKNDRAMEQQALRWWLNSLVLSIELHRFTDLNLTQPITYSELYLSGIRHMKITTEHTLVLAYLLDGVPQFETDWVSCESPDPYTVKALIEKVYAEAGGKSVRIVGFGDWTMCLVRNSAERWFDVFEFSHDWDPRFIGINP